MRLSWSNGLLPISWSSDNGSHLFVDSVDEGSGGFSSIGTYLTHVAENSAGVIYPRERCGRSVVYSSTRPNHLRLRPSLVRSKIKSHVHTSSLPRDGRRWQAFRSCPCSRRGLGLAGGWATFSPA